mmetsp:Transcript_87790/g.256622  ORF Transcript_87790/g.256622 Transcript_87790/m.256622 type:complete len:83 (+) Transcript_87790:1228-1476(+)
MRSRFGLPWHAVAIRVNELCYHARPGDANCPTTALACARADVYESAYALLLCRYLHWHRSTFIYLDLDAAGIDTQAATRCCR